MTPSRREWLTAVSLSSWGSWVWAGVAHHPWSAIRAQLAWEAGTRDKKARLNSKCVCAPDWLARSNFLCAGRLQMHAPSFPAASVLVLKSSSQDLTPSLLAGRPTTTPENQINKSSRSIPAPCPRTPSHFCHPVSPFDSRNASTSRTSHRPVPASAARSCSRIPRFPRTQPSSRSPTPSPITILSPDLLLRHLT